MGLLDWIQGRSTGIKNMSAEEVLERVAAGKAYVVDVRQPEELQGPFVGLAGAKNIPLSDLGRRFGEIPKDRPVILMCRSGHRSLQAGKFLQSQGYTQLHNLEGGLLAVLATKTK